MNELVTTNPPVGIGAGISLTLGQPTQHEALLFGGWLLLVLGRHLRRDQMLEY